MTKLTSDTKRANTNIIIIITVYVNITVKKINANIPASKVDDSYIIVNKAKKIYQSNNYCIQ